MEQVEYVNLALKLTHFMRDNKVTIAELLVALAIIANREPTKGEKAHGV